MTQTIGFGLVRETLPALRRVALTPQGAEQLIARGHAVLLESGAGADAGFSDDDDRAVAPALCLSEIEVVSGADVLVKIHGPLKDDHNLLREGSTITSLMHLFSPESSALLGFIRGHKVNVIAWDLLEENDGGRPVLEAVSAIGRRGARLRSVWW